MKKFYTVLFVTLFSVAASAQTGGLKGIATDGTDGKPVASATVTLLKQSDSSTVLTTVTQADGSFSFAGLAADSLILTISALNFQEYVSYINVYDSLRTLNPIKLTIQGKDLSNVTVVSRTPPVVVKGDTAQFAASQYKVQPDATTEDLIKKMPGITVARDGTVTAQGEQVRKVTIDGKDFFGDDASAALKNLPSEVVDKIQVFDRLSDQAQLTGVDDGNSTKAINVVTKSGLKNGRFGRLFAGYGTDDRYNAGGNASFFKNNRRISLVGNFNNINQQNFASQDLLGVTSSSQGGGGNRGGGGGQGGGGFGGGGFGGGNNFTVGQQPGIARTNAFGLNYNDIWGKKTTVAGSYFFNNTNTRNRSIINTETFFDTPDSSQFTRQTQNSIVRNTNHRITARIEHKFDSSNSLFIIPNLSFQDNNSSSFTNYSASNGLRGKVETGELQNNATSSLNTQRNGYNLRNNILFRHAFKKRGRALSLGFNMNFTKNDGNTFNNTFYQFFKAAIFDRDSLQNQLFDNISDSRTFSGNITYNEPISKTSSLQFEYNPSIQKNNSDQQVFNFDGTKYSALDTSLSNVFDNRITTNNGGVSYRWNPNRDQMFTAGVSYQHSNLQSDRVFPTKLNVNQNFSAVLPNLMWRKKLSASSNIRVFYRASVNFPSVTQLQDVINTSNPLRVSVGNPALDQSYTQFIAGRYSYTNTKTGKSFFANLFLQSANDYITNSTFIARRDTLLQNGDTLRKGSQLTRPVNLDGYRSLRSFFTYAFPLKFIKSNLNLNAGFQYSKLPGLTNNVKFLTNNLVYTGGLVLSSNISEFIDYNVSYNVTLNNTEGGSGTSNRYTNQAAGLQVNLLNKKGWFIQNDVSYQGNSGLTGGIDQNFTLWNAGIGKKFLKNRVGELKLSVFDLLRRNQSVTRTVNEQGIIDSQNDVLQRYFMLTFTYNLKNFGTAKAQSNSRGNSGGPAGPGGPGGPGF